jgi:hypothetical protein
VKTVQLGEVVLEYVEVTLEDIAVANRLAAQVLGRSLDELPPQTRRLLHRVEAWVGAECARTTVARVTFRFTRRQLREVVNMGNVQLGLHLGRLVGFEYLVAHRAGRGGGFEYELVYDGSGKDGAPVLPGLTDVGTLTAKYDSEPGVKSTGVEANSTGATAKSTAPFRGPFGGSTDSKNGQKPNGLHVLSIDGRAETQNAHSGVSRPAASYSGVAGGGR